jgi:hypothetical protein
MRRLLLPLFVLIAAGPLLAACAETPKGSGCWWSLLDGELVAYYPSSGDPFGDYCYELLDNLPPDTTAPSTTAPTTTSPATSTTVAGSFTAGVECIPGLPPRVRLSGTAAPGSVVSLSDFSPYVWTYAFPTQNVNVPQSGAWTVDAVFEPGAAMFPFSVVVTNAGSGVLLPLATGC